jgi:hypothetical protein
LANAHSHLLSSISPIQPSVKLIGLARIWLHNSPPHHLIQFPNPQHCASAAHFIGLRQNAVFLLRLSPSNHRQNDPGPFVRVDRRWTNPPARDGLGQSESQTEPICE